MAINKFLVNHIITISIYTKNNANMILPFKWPKMTSSIDVSSVDIYMKPPDLSPSLLYYIDNFLVKIPYNADERIILFLITKNYSL